MVFIVGTVTAQWFQVATKDRQFWNCPFPRHRHHITGTIKRGEIENKNKTKQNGKKFWEAGTKYLDWGRKHIYSIYAALHWRTKSGQRWEQKKNNNNRTCHNDKVLSFNNVFYKIIHTCLNVRCEGNVPRCVCGWFDFRAAHGMCAFTGMKTCAMCGMRKRTPP